MSHHEWNYHSDDPIRGPHQWAHQFPGVGQAQSPIDIRLNYCDLRQHQQQVGCACGKLIPNIDRDGRHDRSSSASSANSSYSSSSSSSASPLPHSGHSKRAPTKSQRQNTRYCSTNRKLFLGYPRYLNSLKLCNTGHAWQIELPPELAQHTLLCGPPLADREYRLAQLHCHWGSSCDRGSEHLVNGRPYSAEIHFVHWNCTDFASFEEAARHKHGLAVLGVFLQALDGHEQNCNKHLEKIVTALELIRERPHSSVELNETRLDLKKLFPTNRWLYASYEGSLTTPPLSEVVDWIVFLQPVTCSRRQIDAMRQLKCSPKGDRLENNCRPTQATNERVVSIWTHDGR